jgi:hypothetical protein
MGVIYVAFHVLWRHRRAYESPHGVLATGAAILWSFNRARDERMANESLLGGQSRRGIT